MCPRTLLIISGGAVELACQDPRNPDECASAPTNTAELECQDRSRLKELRMGQLGMLQSANTVSFRVRPRERVPFA